MENCYEPKKAWQSPEIEIINAKMTKGGNDPAHWEDAYYYDPYSS